MKTYRIFLASSSELKTERKEFEIFISRENNAWGKRGVRFELIIWEDFLDAVSPTRSQDEYNKAVKDADIFVLLFFSKVGPFTNEEFDTAYKNFLDTGKPIIFTYFKNADLKSGDIEEADILSMFNFKKRLKSIGHFTGKYENTEGLLLDFRGQLDKLVEAGFIELNKNTADNGLIKELTTLIPLINDDDITGRETELSELRRLLCGNRKVVLVNGLGGIGKTMLAQAYLSLHFDEYKHIAWVTQTGTDTMSAFLEENELAVNLNIDESITEAGERFRAIMHSLREIADGPNLLIIDNAGESIMDISAYLPPAPKWHVLVTSRHTIEDFEKLELDFLDETNAVKLFKKHCQRITNDDEIKYIVKVIDYHTLTIELLAKTAEKNNLSAEKVIRSIEDDIKSNVKLKYAAEKDLPLERVATFLSSVFKLEAFSEKEEWLLKQFCLMPSEYINENSLYELLKAESLEWKDEFFSLLADLNQKGWLLHNKTGRAWKMHIVICEAVSRQLNIDLEDVKSLLESVTEKLAIDQTKDNPVDKFQWIPYGKKLQDRFGTNETEEVAHLLNELALVYKNQGQYSTARDLYEESLRICTKIFGEDHSKVATVRSNLANVYGDLGEPEKARDLLELALESGIKNFGEEHPNVAILRSNLANVYGDLGENEKARDLLELALESGIKNFGEEHPNVATRRSNLAIVYRNLGEYEKARDLQELALESDIKNFGEGHPNVARDRSNLANVYRDLNEYEKARDLLELALESGIKNFGEGHPNVTTSRSNLAIVYLNLDEHDKARDLLELALESDIKNFGEKHQSIATSYNNLAYVYLDMKNKTKALELWQKAYEIRLAVLGPQHPHTRQVEEAIERYS